MNTLSSKAQIAESYSFSGPSIHLGALMEAEEIFPNLRVNMALSMLNRHGLIAGATGTGKTKTLQVMAEQIAAAGTNVFVADMKGDLSGLAVPGESSEKLIARAKARGQEWEPKAAKVEFFSLGGQGQGIPIRTTITDFGPTLLAKVLTLNETQESALALIFHYADSNGLALLDLKDLRALIHFLNTDGKAELKSIGGVSAATAGVILRKITQFEASGADVFFQEPAFEVDHFLNQSGNEAKISCLELPAVATRPELFSTFMMWMLAELYEQLPEVGDLDKPKLVFFFDEAHLLFKDASKAFIKQVVQTVRLIRSKGVGVFFITQTPKDIPPDVLAQLGNRIQHALRAFTPDDAKAIKQTANTFAHTEYDLEKLLTQLGTGEAVVTVLNEKGSPTKVAHTAVIAPTSSMQPAEEEEIARIIAASELAGKYDQVVDRESAYEILRARATESEVSVAASKDSLTGETKKPGPAKEEPGLVEKVSKNPAVRSFFRSVGTVLGREITRTIFGTRKKR